MNTRYFRKKDEAMVGGDLDSQSQRPSYSQIQSSQFYHYSNGSGANRMSFGQGNSLNYIGGGAQANATQIDASQNAESGSNSVMDKDFHNAKHEIDLLELCMDINEDTFKQAQNKKNQKESQQRKKMQGTGQFMITKNDNKAKENSKRIYESSTTHVDLQNALNPKVFQKYNISPSVNNEGQSIAGFMGIKQEETKDQHKNLKNHIKEIQRDIKEERPLIHTDKYDEQPFLRLKQKNNARAQQNQKINKKILSIGEFASNLNADDFLNDANKNSEGNLAKDANMEDQYELTVEQYEPAGKSVGDPKKKTFNKKRKKDEMNATNMNLCDELDEQDEDYQQQAKRRKLNTFDKPLIPNKKAITSSFMINKKSLDSKPTEQKPQQINTSANNSFNNQQNIFEQNKVVSNINTRREKCQQAYNKIFNQNPEEPDEYIIVKILFKTRKHGVHWTIGDIADFKMKDPKVSEQLKKNTRKVRVMMPLQNFNASNNSNRPQQRDSHERGSTSSTATNNYPVNGFIVVENPIILSKLLAGDGSNDLNMKDECYLSVLAKGVSKYETSTLINKAKVSINLSQQSNQTV